MSRDCADCGVGIRNGGYSKNQWNKGEGASRCKTCVGRAQNAQQERSSRHSQSQSQPSSSLSSSATSAKHRRLLGEEQTGEAEVTHRACADCGLDCPRDGGYRKNQWNKGEGASRCKECVAQEQEAHRERARRAEERVARARRAQQERASRPPSQSQSHSSASPSAKRRRILEEQVEKYDERDVRVGLTFLNTPGETVVLRVSPSRTTVERALEELAASTGLPASGLRLIRDGRDLAKRDKTLEFHGVAAGEQKATAAPVVVAAEDDIGKPKDESFPPPSQPELYLLVNRPGRDRIHVKVQLGRRSSIVLPLDVEYNATTLGALRGVILDAAGIPPSKLLVVNAGRALFDESKTLSSLGIADGSALEVRAGYTMPVTVHLPQGFGGPEGDGRVVTVDAVASSNSVGALAIIVTNVLDAGRARRVRLFAAARNRDSYGNDGGGEETEMLPDRALSDYGVQEGSTLRLAVAEDEACPVLIRVESKEHYGDVHCFVVAPESTSVRNVKERIHDVEGLPLESIQLVGPRPDRLDLDDDDRTLLSYRIGRGKRAGYSLNVLKYKVRRRPNMVLDLRLMSPDSVEYHSMGMNVFRSSMTVRDVTKMAAFRARVHSNRTGERRSLTHEGRELPLERTLQECGIVEGAILSLVTSGNNDVDADSDSKPRECAPKLDAKWASQPPSENCTASAFLGTLSSGELCDRQRLRWALRTENEVRFAKLEAREEDADDQDDDATKGDDEKAKEGSEASAPSASKAAADLSSDYLIDLYPRVLSFDSEAGLRPPFLDMTPRCGAERLVRADAIARRRAVTLPLALARDPDESYASLRRADRTTEGSGARPSNALARRSRVRSTAEGGGEGGGGAPNSDRAVPPNLFLFRLLLEAYVGYRLPFARSSSAGDPAAMPRAAVMGGAVVAALASWRDPEVRALFEGTPFVWEEEGGGELGADLTESSLEEYPIIRALRLWEEARTPSAAEAYLATRRELIRRLNAYFQFPRNSADRTERSIFSDGDVDVFLQASPLTLALRRTLLRDARLPPDALNLVGSFLGGCGFVQGDLLRYAKGLCPSLENEFAVEGKPASRWCDDEEAPAFVYAVTRHAVSFALTQHQEGTWDDDEVWPRTTQLIVLDEKADLLGGLMDFDISLAACAYDGTGVKITPRAALSLATMTQAVTPFVLQEGRNRRRIKKYFRRGFDAFMIDPFCSHPKQCKYEELATAVTAKPRGKHDDDAFENNNRNYRGGDVKPSVKYTSLDIHGPERYGELLSVLRADSDSPMPVIGIQCCCNVEAFDCRRKHVPNCLTTHAREQQHRSKHWYTGCQPYKYTVALFENTDLMDATEYFAKRHKWTADQLRQVLSFPPTRRFACSFCRREYGLQLVLTEAPSAIQEDDLLHGSASYMHGCGWKGDFNPSFYSGGAFNSLHVGSASKTTVELLSTLRAQQIFEHAKHLQRHGNDTGYSDRFVYGNTVDNVFAQAGRTCFQSAARPPVGLNPERFIERCTRCCDWLRFCEFGTLKCGKCS